MRAIVFGATGMVGQSVLLECLDDADVTAVLTVGRRRVSQENPKLEQVTQPELFDLSPLRDRLTGYDACFFCLGVTSVGKKEPEYSHLTYDLAVAAAELLAAVNPDMAFLYVSGEGTDSTETGKTMWARVKGATENAVMALPFTGYAIRPGFIQAQRNVRSRTPLYRILYSVSGWLFPVLRRLAPKMMIRSGELAAAMIEIARTRPTQRIWNTVDMVALAARQ